jgi:2,4'-dihydroxyacetophenone dioxygenase
MLMEATNPHDPSQSCMLNDGGYVSRLKDVPWTRLSAPGFEAIAYKILSYDDSRGYINLINTFDPGSKFPPHKHTGQVEIYMLSGSFYYDNGKVFAGDFMLEKGGVTHAPASDEGAMMIATFHGPLVSLSPTGEVMALVDIDALYGLAKANNAVGHLPPRAVHRVALTSEG